MGRKSKHFRCSKIIRDSKKKSRVFGQYFYFKVKQRLVYSSNIPWAWFFGNDRVYPAKVVLASVMKSITNEKNSEFTYV